MELGMVGGRGERPVLSPSAPPSETRAQSTGRRSALRKPAGPPATLGPASDQPPYRRDAGVQHGAEEGLAVVGADAGRQKGQQVVLKKALAEKLVEQPAGVEGAQRASEPGVLDGNVHGGAAGSRAGGDSGGASGQHAGHWGAGARALPIYAQGRMQALGDSSGKRVLRREAAQSAETWLGLSTRHSQPQALTGTERWMPGRRRPQGASLCVALSPLS